MAKDTEYTAEYRDFLSKQSQLASKPGTVVLGARKPEDNNEMLKEPGEDRRVLESIAKGDYVHPKLGKEWQGWKPYTVRKDELNIDYNIYGSTQYNMEYEDTRPSLGKCQVRQLTYQDNEILPKGQFYGKTTYEDYGKMKSGKPMKAM